MGTVRQLLDELGAREYCQGMIDGLRSEALEALGAASIGDDGVAAVSRLAGSLLDR